MTLTQAQAGFLKALGVVVLTAVLSFLGNEANLTGVVNPLLATLIAAAVASYESYLKAKSGNTSALFGAVNMR